MVLPLLLPTLLLLLQPNCSRVSILPLLLLIATAAHFLCVLVGFFVCLRVQTGAMVKSFEVCTLPVRCARFIVRKQWFVTASDDMHVRVFNYNTMEKVGCCWFVGGGGGGWGADRLGGCLMT